MSIAVILDDIKETMDGLISNDPNYSDSNDSILRHQPRWARSLPSREMIARGCLDQLLRWFDLKVFIAKARLLRLCSLCDS
jgi:hypothetical protein